MTSPLRIGLVYDDTIDRFGGIGLYVTTLGRAFTARGHHVEYLIGRSTMTEVDGAPVHSLARNVGVRFNGNELSMPLLTSGRRLDRTIAAGDYDVLHVQVPYSPIMAGRLVRRASDHCAVVGTYHVASERLLPQLGARALRVLKLPSAGRFDDMISVSDTAARFARRWSRLDAGHVIPNALARDPACVPPQSVRGADIVFVGRLVPRKGVHELVAAVLQHNATAPRAASLAILGDGPLRRSLELRIARRRDESIRLVGAVDDATKRAYLAQARIACFPSMYGESFGIVIPEALAAGAEMVLGGDNPGYRELLRDPAALIDPTDTSVFAARLAALLDDAEQRRAIGARQQRILDLCDADTVADDVLAMYVRALRRRHPDLAAGPPNLSRSDAAA